MTDPKTSLYCWIVLSIIIFGASTFVISFYNKTVKEINANSIATNSLTISHNILNNDYNNYEEQ